jgi:hypothetical protein
MRLQDWLPTADRRFGLDYYQMGDGFKGAALELRVSCNSYRVFLQVQS